MKNRFIKSVILVVLVMAQSGCLTTAYDLYTNRALSRTKNCPEPGTSVPFSKVMNETFAREYIDCDIETEVYFVGPGQEGYTSDSLKKKGYMVFRVIPPVETENNTNTSATQYWKFVMIPEKESDQIFSFKVGAPLVLRGGTYVRTYTSGKIEVVFIATEAKKK